MILRRSIAVLIAVVVAAQAIRNAAVLAFADKSPATAISFWSGHPAAEISLAMIEIARAARDRRPVPASTFAEMNDAAAKEPLAPEPYLVRGVQAQLNGESETAQRAFEAAQWRDPRSLPAAYFLADRYFRAGEVEPGLREIAALVRLAPNGTSAVAPYLAAYGADPVNWPALRKLFRANPELAAVTLNKLASNIATIPAVLALVDPQQKAVDSRWLQPTLDTLVGAGQYARAREIWARTAGVRVAPDQFLYDSSFTDRKSPPPFNWVLNSSTVGLTERQPGGRLHVLFYGQEDGLLASQLLLLQPGAYRLSMKLLGDPARAHALNWSIWCEKAAEPIASVSLDVAASRSWRFNVPAGCAAQWLKLSGASGDMPQQSDITIAALKLERAEPGA